MPYGQLIFTPKINDAYSDSNDIDTYEEWGLSLEDNAMNALLAPPPNKEPVVNKNQTAWGAQVVVAGLTDERTITLQVHIVSDTGTQAQRRAAFYSKYYAFVSFIKNNVFRIKVRDYSGTLRTTTDLYFLDCQNFRSFDGTMAVFNLSLYEPQPNRFNT